LKKIINPRDVRSVLISRTDSIGDVVLTLPLVLHARQVFREAAIFFYVNENVEPLLTHGLNNVEIVKEPNSENYKEKKAKLSSLNNDLVIFAKPEFELSLIFYSLRTRYRVGTAYRWYSFMYTHRIREHRKHAVKHESEYNLNLLKNIVEEDTAFPLPDRLLGYSETEKREFTAKSSAFGLLPGDKYIVIHPGSRGSANDISSEQFRELASILLEKFPEHTIAFTGIESEKKKIREAMPGEIHGRLIDLAGKLTLRELMMFIDGSELFISNSTGPIHIAGAMNKNIIGFYPGQAPENDVRWKPLGTNVRIVKPADGSNNMSKVEISDAIKFAQNLIKE
jgi:ADP-heptose:LPS heptosyltransferase